MSDATAVAELRLEIRPQESATYGWDGTTDDLGECPFTGLGWGSSVAFRAGTALQVHVRDLTPDEVSELLPDRRGHYRIGHTAESLGLSGAEFQTVAKRAMGWLATMWRDVGRTHCGACGHPLPWDEPTDGTFWDRPTKFRAAVLHWSCAGQVAWDERGGFDYPDDDGGPVTTDDGYDPPLDEEAPVLELVEA